MHIKSFGEYINENFTVKWKTVTSPTRSGEQKVTKRAISKADKPIKAKSDISVGDVVYTTNSPYPSADRGYTEKVEKTDFLKGVIIEVGISRTTYELDAMIHFPPELNPELEKGVDGSKAVHQIYSDHNKYLKNRPAIDAEKNRLSTADIKTLSFADIAKKYNIRNVRQTFIEGKRSKIFTKESTNLYNHPQISKIKDEIVSAVKKWGDPINVTYEKMGPEFDEIRNMQMTEREYAYVTGEYPVLHFGGNKILALDHEI